MRGAKLEAVEEPHEAPRTTAQAFGVSWYAMKKHNSYSLEQKCLHQF
jgi:hypothetical protein